MGTKKDTGSFGDPSWVVKEFDNVKSAQSADKSLLAKNIRELVKSKATPKDNMRVRRVVRATGTAADGKTETKSIAVHVSLGLNGPGRDADYLAALKRLVDTKRFAVVDARIDARDDQWDFLFAWKEA